MKDGKISVDGLTWRKPSGRYVEEIELDEHVNRLTKESKADEAILLFELIGRGIHHSIIDVKRLNAYKQLDHLKPIVERILEEAGWEVHIVDPLKRSEAEDYLHSVGGRIQVFQVPFSAEWNIELGLDKLCNQDGTTRTKTETLALLKEEIGLEAYDLEELSKDQRAHIEAIMKREELDLENLHDVSGQELTTGAQEFRWFRDDEEAEEEAREYLTSDDDLWKECVAAGRTTDGLGEWAEDVLNMDGWAQIVGSFDGLKRVAQLKADGTWFPYIRTN